MSEDDASVRARRPRIRDAWARAVEPREDGLPNRWVIAVPLLVLVALFCALVAAGVTGSSAGAIHSSVSSGQDEDLLIGEPQPIRSDEWFVQTPWTISQVEQGLPIRNATFPGGMDATVQHDLPTVDWSTAFRPHLIGFLALPFDQAMAMKWWLPPFSLIAAVYVFVVTLLPRRPVGALLLALVFYLSPFFQWWFLSITFYPAAWAFFVMTTVLWCLRSRHGWGKWVLAAVTAYLTVAMGTGIYVPFIVPAVLVALGFGLGAVLTRGPGSADFVARLRGVVPVLVAGAAGVAVLGLWVATRWTTIQEFSSTVYPGERLQVAGQARLIDADALLAGTMSVALERTGGQPFAQNSSEAATFLLPGLFLGVVLVWMVVDRARRGAGIDGLSVGVMGAGAVLVLFIFVPGWDPVAHLLLLDRTTYGRMRLGLGIVDVAMIVLVCLRWQQRRDAGWPRPPWWTIIAGPVLAAVVGAREAWVAVRAFLDTAAPPSRSEILLVVALAVAFTIAVVLLSRAMLEAGSAVLLVVALVSTVWVNPLYRGALDLRETSVAAEVERLTAEQPGEWVGIWTTWLPTMVLVETGTPSYNGFQSAPSPEMWEQIDPDDRYEQKWNRLGNVSWVLGSGAPVPRNPAPDQVQMTFDSCYPFAQQHVTWVLSEVPVPQDCLALETTVTEGPTTFLIYRVEPAPAP